MVSLRRVNGLLNSARDFLASADEVALRTSERAVVVNAKVQFHVSLGGEGGDVWSCFLPEEPDPKFQRS